MKQEVEDLSGNTPKLQYSHHPLCMHSHYDNLSQNIESRIQTMHYLRKCPSQAQHLLPNTPFIHPNIPQNPTTLDSALDIKGIKLPQHDMYKQRIIQATSVASSQRFFLSNAFTILTPNPDTSMNQSQRWKSFLDQGFVAKGRILLRQCVLESELSAVHS